MPLKQDRVAELTPVLAASGVRHHGTPALMRCSAAVFNARVAIAAGVADLAPAPARRRLVQVLRAVGAGA